MAITKSRSKSVFAALALIASGALVGALTAAAQAPFTGACPDHNLDGVVDASDLSAHAVLMSTGDLAADYSGNGVVNQVDTDIIAFYLGQVVDCSTFVAAGEGVPVDPVSLSIAKTDGLDTANAGVVTTYTVTVTNAGGVDAVGVQVLDTLPGIYTDVTNISDGGVILGNQITWNDLTVPKFGSVQLTYQGKVASSLAVGTTTLTNTAVLGCTSNPNCDFSGTAVDTTDVTVAPLAIGAAGTPALGLSKSVNVEGPVAPGTELEYTVTVTNAASATADALNVVLTDTLPAGFSFKVTGLGTGSFPMGDLEIGGTKSITYAVIVGEDVVDGTYNNVATAKGDNTDTVTVSTPVEVEQLQVLGASVDETVDDTEQVEEEVKVLAATGPAPFDYLIYLVGMAAVSLGAYGLRRFAVRKA